MSIGVVWPSDWMPRTIYVEPCDSCDEQIVWLAHFDNPIEYAVVIYHGIGEARLIVHLRDFPEGDDHAYSDWLLNIVHTWLQRLHNYESAITGEVAK